MFGNDRRWPAATLAAGLLAFVWTGGAAAQEQRGQHEQHDHGAVQEPQEQHDHGAAHDHSQMEGQTEEAHDHSAMDHNAAPATVEPGQPAKTLTPDALDAPAETSVRDAQRSAEIAEEMSGGGHEGHGGQEDHSGHGGHSGHGTGTYRQVDAGRDSEAHDHESHQHGEEGSQEAAAYVCPMHPEVTSATPAKCSKCGMDLVQRRKE